MTKSNLQNRLSKSIEEASKQVDKRFEQAEEIFLPEIKKEVTETKKTTLKRKSFTLTEEEFRFIKSVEFEFAREEIEVTGSEVIRMGLLLLKNLGKEKINIIGQLRGATNS